MRITTDRVSLTDTLRFGLALVAVSALAGQSGCAKMKASRQPVSNQPVEFGTDFPPINDTRPGFSPNGPNGAQGLQGPQASPPLTAPPQPIDTTSTRSSAHPKADIVAPISIPPIKLPDPIVIRTPDVNVNLKAGETLASVMADARAAVDRLKNYQVTMTHQERMNGQLNPAEDVVLSVRRDPKAVRLEWRDGAHKGREVIYVADSGKGTMHIHMGDSVFPIPDLKMPPDSPLALKNSRHPINEAGFETIVAGIEKYMKTPDAASGYGMKLTYAGLERAPGLDKPCQKVVRITPQGDQWLVYLDPANHLPTLVQGTAANGDLIERYLFRNPTTDRDDLAQADAFNPAARWGMPAGGGGFFQKLARANSTLSDSSPKPQ